MCAANSIKCDIAYLHVECVEVIVAIPEPKKENIGKIMKVAMSSILALLLLKKTDVGGRKENTFKLQNFIIFTGKKKIQTSTTQLYPTYFSKSQNRARSQTLVCIVYILHT